MSYLSNAKMVKLEKDYLPVESEYFNNVVYAIDRQGKGMHVLVGKQSIPVAADSISTFATEMCAVWDAMKTRVV